MSISKREVLELLKIKYYTLSELDEYEYNEQAQYLRQLWFDHIREKIFFLNV